MMRRFLLFVMLASAGATAVADEGMWTVDNFPVATVRDKYGVTIDQDWLDRVRLSTVRLEGGCTGSFVSPDGLVLTNHHCVRRCISDISTAENDVQEDGFVAASRAEERPCPSSQISVLVGFEDITEKVEVAVAGKSEQEANDIRKQTLTRLEQACEEAADQAGEPRSCEAVNLYKGGQYFIYRYKRYDDVRLAFAPEGAIAHFGGDPDNFNFPRWCLDMALLRAYEDGAPAATPQHLRWRREGAKENEPVFISGHPGSTERLLTLAELRFMRDVTLANWLLRYSELRGRMIQYATQGAEQARFVAEPLQQIENAIKVRRNQLFSLFDEEVLARKAEQEEALREAVAAAPEFADAYGGAWDAIELALDAQRNFYEEWLFAEQGAAFSTVLFNYAHNLVRVAAERDKPNDERLREYTDAALPRLEQVTLAPRPFDPDLEALRLSFSLEKMREWLGPDDQFVQMVLGDASPASRAAELVGGTTLGDPAVRAALWEGGSEAIAASDDPMIVLARTIDPYARALRERYEDEVEAPIQTASEQIARARFAIQGTSTYPDATFTLRVTYGAVQGWVEKGEPVFPFTTATRLYERATGEPPFALPPKWVGELEEIGPDTRFNFVATLDITGGNSGSPIIDADANLVGLAFDGNIHSIAGSYYYDPALNRAVGVHPAIMVRALEKIYDAGHLVDELDVD
jgi:hypothetical protein